MAEYPEILREYNYEEALDHVVEYPGAFRERDIGGGRILHEPDEGAIIQPGTPLSAKFFNRKEYAIWSLFGLYEELFGLWEAGFPVINGPDAIAAGANLNNLTDLKHYFVSDNATAATLVNCPVIVAFELTVTKHSGLRQVLRANDGRTFERDNAGTAWTDWIEVARVGKLAKADVDLGLVDNVRQASKTEFESHITDPLPHRFHDASTGENYRWGIGINSSGGMVIKYEVI